MMGYPPTPTAAPAGSWCTQGRRRRRSRSGSAPSLTLCLGEPCLVTPPRTGQQFLRPTTL